MDVSRIVAEIDAQISKLRQARALLAGTGTFGGITAEGKAKRGSPKGSGKQSSSSVSNVATAPKTKRKLGAAGRKAIADAMKKRWAERKKAQR